jgi:hypothetical protein
MNSILLGLVMAQLVLPFSAGAQEKPNFSGTWTMETARSQSPTYPGFVGPITLVIEQTPTTLTVQTTQGGNTTKDEFKLYDSKPVDAPLAVPSFRAYWIGDTLVGETARNINDQTVQTEERRTLDPTGKEMTVETTLIVQHGYTLKGTQNHTTAKDVFKKVEQ